MTEPAVSTKPLIRAGLRRFLELDRWDLVWLLVLVAGSLLLRLISPITAGVTPAGQPVSSGLGYPWNGGEGIPSGQQCGSQNSGGLPVDAKTGKPVVHDPQANDTSGYITVCGFVFDEVYFPPDALRDLHQPAIDYFDPEPPLTKLLMTPSVTLLGFNTWGWRFTCALFGSLLVGMMYLIAKRLRPERFFAVAAALFVSLDGLAFVESRIGVIDIIAIFWAAFTYYAFLLHWQARTRMQWRATAYFLGASVGLGFAAKLTELAPLAVAGAFLLLRSLEPTLRRWIGRWRPSMRNAGPEGKLWRAAAGWNAPLHYLVAVGLVVLVFGLSFSRYVTVTHPGVVQYDSCSLPGGPGDSKGPDPNVVPPQMSKGISKFLSQAYHDIYALNSSALSYHSMECRSHPYQSRWFTWPIDYRPVLMYSGSAQVTCTAQSTAPATTKLDPGCQHSTDDKFLVDGNSQTTVIANYGNPAVWWLGLPALLFCCWMVTRGRWWWRLGLPLFGLASIAVMIFSVNHSMMYWDSTKATTDHPIPVYSNSKWVVSTANHKPGQPDSVYTSADAFRKATGHNPGPSDEFPVSPGPLFTIGFGGVALFCIAAVGSGIWSRRFVPTFIVIGYLASWMMWAPGNNQRILFFYHALGILLFTALALAYSASELRRWRVPNGKHTWVFRPAAYALCGVVVASFVFFYPVWTGTPLPQADNGMRVWYDTQ